jgi:DNA-binding CsgD family transcriptional regulator
VGSDDKPTAVRPVKVARGRAPGEIACVEVLSGSSAGKLFPLTTGSTILGRGSTSDLALDDDGVSRLHAKIAISEDGVVNLIDLDSTNGTYLNGARIDVSIVREGDRIQIGSDVTVQFVYRKRDELRRRPEPEAQPGPTLSKREREVAVLVAEGLTSQEIADRLHISPRTVTTHLGNVYERLSLSGRAALARWVVQHGLMAE